MKDLTTEELTLKLNHHKQHREVMLNTWGVSSSAVTADDYMIKIITLELNSRTEQPTKVKVLKPSKNESPTTTE